MFLGTVAAVDPDSGDTLAYRLRGSDPPNRMYMTGSSDAALYSVDSDDFEATRVGTSVPGFGVGETDPSGMAWHNGELYMIGRTTDALYTLDPYTGEAMRVDADVAQFGVGEGLPQDLASHGGNLYMVG